PVAVGDDYSLPSDRFVRGVTYWATLPVKYLLASFIDGLGKGAWENMLRRTQEVYPARLEADRVQWIEGLKQTNAMPSPGRPKAAATIRALTTRQERRAERYAAAGLPIFIEALRRQQSGDPNLEVTLVGHSMGTIILNRV